MSKQTINLGTIPSGVGGDTPRSAFTKAQANFDEIYTALGGTTIPATLPITRGGTGKTCMGAAALGTVSQSAGVPTGAVFESGTNANGKYIKFADGTLICYGTFPTFNVGANVIATVTPVITFPAAYMDLNYTAYVFGTPTLDGNVYGFTYNYGLGPSTMSMVYRNGTTAQQVTNCRWSTIGRWF